MENTNSTMRAVFYLGTPDQKRVFLMLDALQKYLSMSFDVPLCWRPDVCFMPAKMWNRSENST